MKSVVTRTAISLSVFFSLFAVMAFLPNNRPTATEEELNGFWVAKSGDEFVVLSESKVAEAAITRDSKGVVKSVDQEMLKRALRYTNRSTTANGKAIEAEFFAISREMLSTDMKSVSPKTGKLSPVLTTQDLQSAYLVCHNQPVTGWKLVSSCSSGVCTAVKYTNGLTVYLVCNNE